MKKGLSSWLFSKLVMLSFLIITFTIMAGFLMILNERAYVDSAFVLTLQLKEATSGVANSNVVEINKMVPIPKVLPSDKSSNARMYYIVVKQRFDGGNPSAVSFAITKNLIEDDVFVSSSLLYTDVTTNLAGDLVVSSKDYRYLVILKKADDVSFYACNRTSVTGYSDCIKGGAVAVPTVVT